MGKVALNRQRQGLDSGIQEEPEDRRKVEPMWMYVNVMRISPRIQDELVLFDGGTSLQVENEAQSRESYIGQHREQEMQ